MITFPVMDERQFDKLLTLGAQKTTPSMASVSGRVKF
jgi:hypothetical protein